MLGVRLKHLTNGRKVAGRKVSATHVGKLRILLAASIDHERTAGMKATTGRRVEGAGLLTFEDTVRFLVGHRFGNRFQESPGIGVRGIAKELGCRRQLDDLSQVHYRDPIACVLDDAKVVSDEEIGKM